MTCRNLLSTALAATLALPAAAATVSFSTGSPDGKIGTGSRPSSPGKIEIESADDFILDQAARLDHATFTGLLPSGFMASDIGNVRVEIYRVFPKDSNDPPSGNVPTRTNSPSDVAFDERESASGSLSYSLSVLDDDFAVANSVLNGIHPIPNQTTGGEGAARGAEVTFDISLLSPFLLPADHYFFVPQVELANGDFLWLSAPKPTSPPFVGDLQSWMRNENLAPDWLRIGTDIVGGKPGADIQRGVFVERRDGPRARFGAAGRLRPDRPRGPLPARAPEFLRRAGS